MRVAIIGAGPSGLAAAKVFQADGHTVEVFEKSGKIGGVWTVCYPGAKLQNTYREYCFSDFSHKESVDVHPTVEQVLEYLEAYAEKFQLKPLIRFHHEVVTLERPSDKAGWIVKLRDSVSKRNLADRHFDYVLIAKGQFYDNPHVPPVVREELESMNRTFKGEIMHDRSYRDFNQIKDKKVAVIGFGKTALDLSVQAVELGKEAHIIYREPRWTLPLFIFGLVRTHVLLFGRHAALFMNSWFMLPWQRFLHTYLPFLPWLFWRTLEIIICFSHGIHPWHSMVPKQRMEAELRSAVAVAPEKFYTYIKEGKLHPHHSEVSGFKENGIVLKNGEFIEADVVIAATGFTFDLNMLPNHKHLISSDGIYLYRHMIHPDLPDLAFVGFNHGFVHLPTTELGLYWLLVVLKGGIKLPSREEQLAEIQRVKKWKEDHMQYEATRALTVGPRYSSYSDELLTDLGVSTQRGSNFITDLLVPTHGHDYRRVINNIKQKYKKILSN